ncbi:hypothetical protein QAD02_011391 [Eretmocerus hayati]|uniref:Uncharacterized protein n=1 Tax=Eretmocerus hayati TaxID=131215 RepID=A0ACC2NWM4_9HYME|nr:hypothetical protein QAD02_011391 [Eretmocerus hayati]
MESSEDAVIGVSHKIQHLADLNHEITKGLISIQADFNHVNGLNVEHTNQILLGRLERLEKDVVEVLNGLQSLREPPATRSDNDVDFIVVADSVPPQLPTSEVLQESNKERKGCGGACCETEGLITSSGIKVFCGENMSAKDWVANVDQVICANNWGRNYAYSLIMKALRGKARKVALRLLEKTLLDIEITRGEPDRYEDTSIETAVLWQRKLSDEEVLHRVVGLEDRADCVDWNVMKEILLKPEEWDQVGFNGLRCGLYLGFDALVKLENS